MPSRAVLLSLGIFAGSLSFRGCHTEVHLVLRRLVKEGIRQPNFLLCKRSFKCDRSGKWSCSIVILEKMVDRVEQLADPIFANSGCASSIGFPYLIGRRGRDRSSCWSCCLASDSDRSCDIFHSYIHSYYLASLQNLQLALITEYEDILS